MLTARQPEASRGASPRADTKALFTRVIPSHSALVLDIILDNTLQCFQNEVRMRQDLE